jgi:hypothetical protein
MGYPSSTNLRHVGQRQPRRRKLQHRAPAPERRGVVVARAQGGRMAHRGQRGIGRRDQVARRIGKRAVEIENDRVAHLLPPSWPAFGSDPRMP